MRYNFSGDYFLFEMNLDSLDQVENTILRCSKAYKTHDHWIGRRIKKVIDELGIVVYQNDK